MSDLPDYYPGGSDMALKPEWEAIQGNDKNFFYNSGVLAFGGFNADHYVVPADKTLFIKQVTFSVRAAAAANADFNQIGEVSIGIFGGAVLHVIGGNGGGQLYFDKPLVIEGGETMFTGEKGSANHDTIIFVTVAGYEV